MEVRHRPVGCEDEREACDPSHHVSQGLDSTVAVYYTERFRFFARDSRRRLIPTATTIVHSRGNLQPFHERLNVSSSQTTCSHLFPILRPEDLVTFAFVHAHLCPCFAVAGAAVSAAENKEALFSAAALTGVLQHITLWVRRDGTCFRNTHPSAIMFVFVNRRHIESNSTEKGAGSSKLRSTTGS